jgi:hypothetical protein
MASESMQKWIVFNMNGCRCARDIPGNVCSRLPRFHVENPGRMGGIREPDPVPHGSERCLVQLGSI